MQRVRREQVFVLLVSGFEEVDVSTVIRNLRRFGFLVTVVGLTAGSVRGAYGVLLVPEAVLGEVENEQPCAVVLPGGSAECQTIERRSSSARLAAPGDCSRRGYTCPGRGVSGLAQCGSVGQDRSGLC